MSLLKWLSNISPFRGMPVDDTGSSSSVTAQSGETVQLYYNAAGTLTADAGQAAGVVVMGKTTYDNVLNLLGDSMAKKGDTSLSFTSTALTSEVGRGVVEPEFVESLDEASWIVRMREIGLKLAQGEYYFDANKGVFYAKKASTQSTLTSVAYKYHSSATGGAVSGDINKVGGVAVPTAGADGASNTRSDVPTSARISGFNGTTWDRLRAGITVFTATVTGWLNVIPGLLYNAAPAVRTEGQYGAPQCDSTGAMFVNPKALNSTNDTVGAVPATPVSGVTGAYVWVYSAALEASHVVSANPTKLYKLYARIDSALATGTYYVQTFNNATLPADSAGTLVGVPKKVAHVSGTTDLVAIDYTGNGVGLSIGLVVVLSTTDFTKTISSANMAIEALVSNV